MILSESNIYLPSGLKKIKDILSPTDYYTVAFENNANKSKILEVCTGSASWETHCPKDVFKIVTKDNHICCDAAQKVFIDYGLYGIKETTVGKLVVGDSILCISENHYYSYYQRDDSDADITIISAAQITLIECWPSSSLNDIVFYKTYVQGTKNFIANDFVLIC